MEPAELSTWEAMLEWPKSRGEDWDYTRVQITALTNLNFDVNLPLIGQPIPALNFFYQTNKDMDKFKYIAITI